MAKWSEMSSGSRSALVVVIVALIGGAGYGIWKSGQPAPEPAAQSQATGEAVPAPATPEPAPDAAPAPAAPAEDAATAAAAPQADAAVPAAEPAPAAAPAPAPVPPKSAQLDLVRIEPDGSATIAGQGEPGSTISLQLDGTELASVLVGPAGKFATLFTIPPSDKPRMLVLTETLADGTVVAGSASVAISPFAPPPAVVASTDQPAPAPAATEAAAGAAAGAADTPAPAMEAAAPAATTETATEAAAEAPTAVIVDDTGVTVAQSGMTGNVTLDAIAYDAAGNVQLAGKATPGNVVQVYVDNTLAAAVDAGPDGSWRASPEIAPGVHTLRLDELDAGGKVVSRFETPMQRETLETLAEAQAQAQAGAEAKTAGTEVADAAASAQAAPAKTTAADAGAAAATAETAAPAATPEPAPAADASPAGTEGSTETAPADAVPAAAASEPAPAAAPATEAPAAAPATDAEVTADAGAAATAPAASADAAPQTPGLVTVVVQPGFTLWGIAKSQLGSGMQYVQIFDSNRTQIKDPDLIYPGQVFLIPEKK